MMTTRRFTLGALCALLLLMTAGSASAVAAPAPSERLLHAERGTTVRLAPGVTYTVGAVERRGATVRIRGGRLRLGTVARGEDVRLTARGGTIRLAGGRFTVAAGLTAERYTVAPSAPLVIREGAGAEPEVSGRLTVLRGGRVRAADVTEGEVAGALPAAPGGQRWRVGLGLDLHGLTVRLYLNEQQVGSGRVRFDGSYRLGLALRDFPALGARVSADGEVAGRDIRRPDPITSLRGRVDGTMRLTDDVGVGNGTLAWDGDGMQIDADVTLGCREGAVTARVAGTYADDRRWSFRVGDGERPASGGCKVAEDATVSAASVAGGLATDGGPVTGELTVSSPQGAALDLGSGASVSRPWLRFTGSAIAFGGSVRVPCPAGGGLDASVRAEVPIGRTARAWSAQVGLRAGDDGCGLVKDLRLDAGSPAQATLGATDGELGIDVDADVTASSTLIPTQDRLSIAMDMRISRRVYRATFSGRGSGVTYRGSIATDGTFSLTYELTNLRIRDVRISASGRIARTTRGGPIEQSLSANMDGQIRLTPNIAIVGGSIGLRGNKVTLGGMLRLKCTTGSTDFGFTGTFEGTSNITLDLSQISSNCTLGKLARLDGQTLAGRIEIRGRDVNVDIAGTITSVSFPAAGVLDEPTFGALDVSMSDTQVRITSTCADGCKQYKLRFDLRTRVKLTYTQRMGHEGVTVIEGTSTVVVEMNGPESIWIEIGLFDTMIDGRPALLTVEMAGFLRRAIGSGFVFVPARPGDPPSEAAGGPSAGELDGPLRLGRVQRIGVRVRAGRPAVALTLSRRGPVTVEIQQRRCSGCRWRSVTYRVVRAPKAKTLRVGFSSRLARGGYRVVARMGTAGSGAAKTRRFTVR